MEAVRDAPSQPRHAHRAVVQPRRVVDVQPAAEGGGVDYKDLHVKSVHRHVGVVSQETQLFNTTIGRCTIDLSTEEGRQRLWNLLKVADVVIDGYTQGARAALPYPWRSSQSLVRGRAAQASSRSSASPATRCWHATRISSI